MGALLTTASTMMCPHGGTVSATAGQQHASAGALVLVQTDTCTIAGCAFAPGGAAHPCVTVRWIVAATRVTHGGVPVLNDASVGLCLAGDQAPQGTVQIVSTQSKASGL